MTILRPLLLAAVLATPVARLHAQATPATGSKYLFAWVGDDDRKVSDFLAVLDANPASKTYGHVLASVPVGETGTMPHHTEYLFPADAMLVANGWAANHTFIFNLKNPTAPKVAASFHRLGDYSFPHSFARLPNNHLVGTFQAWHDAYAPPGGLVEFDEQGKFVRSSSAVGPGMPADMAWPYSLAVDGAHDRILTTSAPMETPPWLVDPPGSWDKARVHALMTNQVQLWSISGLQLLKTLELPKPPSGDFNLIPSEPRLLPDGSFYIVTFMCGLYHLTGATTANPQVKLVHTYRPPTTMDKLCGVPAIVGHYFIVPVPSGPELEALDITDPAHPVEVSYLHLPDQFDNPHWLASDPKASRLVLVGDHMNYIAIVNVDPETGSLSFDQRFRDERTGEVGVDLNGRTWPFGTIAHAVPHGTLFGPR